MTSTSFPYFFLPKSLPLPPRKSRNFTKFVNPRRLHVRLSNRPVICILAANADVFSDGWELEDEIFEFMRKSTRPDKFPTKEELVSAGRRDLAEAVVAHGGWLAFGWDLGDDNFDSSRERVVLGDSEEDFGTSSRERVGVNDSEEDFGAASSSGREMDGSEDAGIGGILSRLEKERRLSLGFGGKGKVVNGRDSLRRNSDRDQDHSNCVGGSRRNKRAASSVPDFDMVENFRNIHLNNKEIDDVNHINSAPDMWRNWILQRTGFRATDFEAAEIVPTYNTKTLGNKPINGDSMNDSMHFESPNIENLSKNMDDFGTDKNQMRLRLQKLEADLTSALHVLKSRANGVASQKVEDGFCDELNKLSDAWEFQETEIMKGQHKIRSIRAKLAVIEGKLALEMIEANKVLEEKQIKLHAAESALSLLHTTCIVWPNSASEVLLAGSFDGWASQRRMEKSSSGFFLLHLKLYPGRYEIKFIVDGVWKSDPLRPVVHNNGHENNLLIIN